MDTLAYGVIFGGTMLWLLIVFQVLLGLRVIKLPGATHSKVHRITGIALACLVPFHGLLAVGHLFLGWF